MSSKVHTSDVCTNSLRVVSKIAWRGLVRSRRRAVLGLLDAFWRLKDVWFQVYSMCFSWDLGNALHYTCLPQSTRCCTLFGPMHSAISVRSLARHHNARSCPVQRANTCFHKLRRDRLVQGLHLLAARFSIFSVVFSRKFKNSLLSF